MTPAPARAATRAKRSKSGPPDRASLRKLYRSMVLSRRLDEAEIALRKRNEAFFQISGAGHEAVNVAAAHCLKPGHDWFFTYYRDRAMAVHMGLTALDALRQAVGSADDPSSAARQMPCHYTMVDEHFMSRSSCTGMQSNAAAGAAEAGMIALRAGIKVPAEEDEIVYMSIGEGATHEGEFHEAVTTACIRKLPLLIVVEHNAYAISVPAEENIPGGDITTCLASYPNLAVYDTDGTDLIGYVGLLNEIVPKMRTRELGPVLIQAHVTRPYSHSLSDDHEYYRTKEELAAETARDCIPRFEKWLTAEGGFADDQLATIRVEVDSEVREAIDTAIAAEKPAPETALDHLYTTENNPTDVELFGGKQPAPKKNAADPVPMGQAINRCLADEMRHDSSVVIFGQDVADATKPEALETCKGKGGVFKITAGLQREFGSDRAFNGPIAEANIAGRAGGMAMRGLRPVCEIQFFDYIWPAMMQIRNEIATTRYRSGGKQSAPVVIRTPIGGYLRGGSIYHSQTGESAFAQIPGLRVAYPSNTTDAVGLLRTAIRCDDPVLFLEHKHLYYQGYNRAPYPGKDYTLPFGQASIRREGRDLTIVTWGALVQKSLEAAERLSKDEGLQAEVIDIRTISPLDMDTIVGSVRRTHRVVVAHEEATFAGFGGEIASAIAEEAFEWLDAPVRRVGSKHTWVAYSPVLEEAILPQTNDVYNAMREVVKY